MPNSDQGENQGETECEMMVVDILNGEEVSDPSVITYITAHQFDGQVSYVNLIQLQEGLKVHRHSSAQS